jgi:hypothetical protein
VKLTWGKQMRIYKVTIRHKVKWFDHPDGARELAASSRTSDLETIEIPFSRLGLVKWLNEHYTRES